MMILFTEINYLKWLMFAIGNFEVGIHEKRNGNGKKQR